jgi:hypothetical protein
MLVPARFHNENNFNLFLRSYTSVTVIILSLYIYYSESIRIGVNCQN